MAYPWDILGIPARNATVKDVRSAYARKLRDTRPDEQPEKFQQLLAARDAALLLVQNRDVKARGTSRPAPSPKPLPPVEPAEQPAPKRAAPERESAPGEDHPSTGEQEPANFDENLAPVAPQAARVDYPAIQVLSQVLDQLQVMFLENITGQNISENDLSLSLPLWKELVRCLGELPLDWRRNFEFDVISLLANVMPRVATLQGRHTDGRPQDQDFCKIVQAIDEEFAWESNDKAIYNAVSHMWTAKHIIKQLKAVRGQPAYQETVRPAQTIDRTKTLWSRFLGNARTIVIAMILIRIGLYAIESYRSPSSLSNIPALTSEEQKAVDQKRQMQSAALSMRIVKISGFSFDFLTPLTARTELRDDISKIRTELEKRLIANEPAVKGNPEPGEDLWELATILTRDLQLSILPSRGYVKTREAVSAALAWELSDDSRKKALLLHGRLSILIAAESKDQEKVLAEAGTAIRSLMQALVQTDSTTDRRFISEVQTAIAIAMLLSHKNMTSDDLEKVRIIMDEVAAADNPYWPASTIQCRSEANAANLRNMFPEHARVMWADKKVVFSVVAGTRSMCPNSGLRYE